MSYNGCGDDDERLIEDLLTACAVAAEAAPMRFTRWERRFLAEAADRNETLHLTPAQVGKLRQIHAERVVCHG